MFESSLVIQPNKGREDQLVLSSLNTCIKAVVSHLLSKLNSFSSQWVSQVLRFFFTPKTKLRSQNLKNINSYSLRTKWTMYWLTLERREWTRSTRTPNPFTPFPYHYTLWFQLCWIPACLLTCSDVATAESEADQSPRQTCTKLSAVAAQIKAPLKQRRKPDIHYSAQWTCSLMKKQMNSHP